MTAFFLKLKPWQAILLILGIPLVFTLIIKFIYERFNIFPALDLETIYALFTIDAILAFVCIYLLPVIILYSAAFGLGRLFPEAALKNSQKYTIYLLISLLILSTVLEFIPGINWIEEDILIISYLLLLLILLLVLAYFASRAIRSAELKATAAFKEHWALWATYLIPIAGVYIYQMRINKVVDTINSKN